MWSLTTGPAWRALGMSRTTSSCTVQLDFNFLMTNWLFGREGRTMEEHINPCESSFTKQWLRQSSLHLSTMKECPVLCQCAQPDAKCCGTTEEEKACVITFGAVSYRLQLLLLLDQELQHQIDICQVQVLLVRTQHILEHLPPRPILAWGWEDQRHWSVTCVVAPVNTRLKTQKVHSVFASRLRDDPTLVSSPPTFASVWGSVHLLECGRGWSSGRERDRKAT